MEVALQMRNQTAPWLFGGIVRACDWVGLTSPRAWLWAIDSAIAVWTWLGFWALYVALRDSLPSGLRRVAGGLGWFFAFFWGFPWIWSRPLSEALSFAPAAFLFLAASRGQWFRAGLWAGVAGILRYPSFLWAAGALLLALFEGRRERWPARAWATGLARAIAGFALAVGVGGWADYAAYGKWLGSLPNYFAFNQPGGPVSQMFGNDDLITYWRWWEFLFTPWLAFPVMGLAVYALARQPALALFIAPYVLGHVWTPHREPRFMLPLTPFLAYAVAREWATPRGQALVERIGVALSARPVWRRVVVALAALHLLFNFAWYPALAWAQVWSGQGIILRSYASFARKTTDFLSLAETPLGAIDAWLHPSVRWAGPECQWHRPEPAWEPERLWVMTRGPAAPNCRLLAGLGDLHSYRLAERWLRVRFANLYECPRDTLPVFCPGGMADPLPGEPRVGGDLRR